MTKRLLNIKWLSNGYQSGIKWLSKRYQMVIKAVSNGYQSGIKWLSNEIHSIKTPQIRFKRLF
jgi:ribosome modulation factor